MIIGFISGLSGTFISKFIITIMNRKNNSENKKYHD